MESQSLDDLSRLRHESIYQTNKCKGTQTIRPGAVLLEKGQICDQIFLIKKGRLKAYAFDNSGNEIILDYANPGDFSSNIISFLEEHPSAFRIIADTESELSSYSKKQIFESFNYSLYSTENEEFWRGVFSQILQRTRNLNLNINNLLPYNVLKCD